MAPKGAKRAAATKAAGAPKRVKLSPEEEMLQRVVAVLQGAEQLPASCREMLVTMAAGSLITLKDERHPSQERVAAMIGAALEEVRATKAAAAAAEEAKVQAADDKMAALQAAAAAADSELLGQSESACAAEQTAAAAQAAAAEASGACDAAAEAQRLAQAREGECQAEVSALEAALKDQFAVLMAGTWESAEHAQDLLQRLAPFTEQLVLDESLRTAMPAAAARLPSERGSFDALVMEQAQKAMEQRAEELRAKLAGCAPAMQDAAAAVEAAQGKLAQAQAQADELAGASQAAQEKEAELATACKAAAQEVKAFTKELKQIRKALDAAQAEVELLQAPLDAFATLCEKTSKVAEAAAEAETPAAVIAEGGA